MHACAPFARSSFLSSSSPSCPPPPPPTPPAHPEHNRMLTSTRTRFPRDSLGEVRRSVDMPRVGDQGVRCCCQLWRPVRAAADQPGREVRHGNPCRSGTLASMRMRTGIMSKWHSCIRDEAAHGSDPALPSRSRCRCEYVVSHCSRPSPCLSAAPFPFEITVPHGISNARVRTARVWRCCSLAEPSFVTSHEGPLAGATIRGQGNRQDAPHSHSAYFTESRPRPRPRRASHGTTDRRSLPCTTLRVVRALVHCSTRGLLHAVWPGYSPL